MMHSEGDAAQDLVTKFIENIAVHADGCWIWQKVLTPHGYGVICATGGQRIRVHRLSYAIFKGELDDTLVIDHLCGNKGCSNPDHLEQVEQSINVARHYTKREECYRGHEFTTENTVIYARVRPYRQCRICLRIDNRDYKRRVRARGALV